MPLHGLRLGSRQRRHARHLPELFDHVHGEVIGGELFERGNKFRIDDGIWVRNCRRSFWTRGLLRLCQRDRGRQSHRQTKAGGADCEIATSELMAHVSIFFLLKIRNESPCSNFAGGVLTS